ncbi:MAG: hypothetical protein IJ748_04125 [Bacteroidales bacterium]|nr:hypothetical protein [Bacteroidales bacterium]
MIVSIFRRNYFLQFVLLLVVPVVLWLPAFINPPALAERGVLDMPLYEAFSSLFAEKSFCAVLFAFVAIILQGLLINYICTSYQLSQKTSYFPAFVYILLMSSDYRSMTLTSVCIANLFLILSLFAFLKCYNKNEGLDEIYLSTVLLSVASLFYSPVILLVFWIWVGLFNFKIYKLRSFFVSIFGFLTPYVVLMVYYYLNNEIQTIQTFFTVRFTVLPEFSFFNQPIQIVYMVYLFALSLPAFAVTYSYRNEQKLSVRKRISTILLLFVFSLLPFVYDISSCTMSLIFAPALACMLTIFFFSVKRSIYSDVYILILFILTLVKILLNC